MSAYLAAAAAAAVPSKVGQDKNGMLNIEPRSLRVRGVTAHAQCVPPRTASQLVLKKTNNASSDKGTFACSRLLFSWCSDALRASSHINILKVAAAVNFSVVCCHIIIAAVVIADAATKKSVQAVVSLEAAVFFCVVCCSLGKN